MNYNLWNGGSTMQCMIQVFCYFCIKSILFSFKIGACDWQLSLQAMEKMVESLLVGFLILICMMLPVSLIVFWDCFQTSRIGKFFLNTNFFHYICTWSGDSSRTYLIWQIIWSFHKHTWYSDSECTNWRATWFWHCWYQS